MDCHIGAVAKRILLHNYSFLSQEVPTRRHPDTQCHWNDADDLSGAQSARDDTKL